MFSSPVTPRHAFSPIEALNSTFIHHRSSILFAIDSVGISDNLRPSRKEAVRESQPPSPS